MRSFNLFTIFFFFYPIYTQELNIRSTLYLQDGIVLDPDSHKPYSDLAIEYYENGQTKVRAHYSRGLINGYWSFYYDNGQLESRGRYYMLREENLEGIPEDGRVGKWTFWHKNGAKKGMGMYKDGKMDGYWTTWYNNGYKQTEGRYWNGRMHGKWISWYSNGIKQEEGLYNIGYIDGKWNFWNTLGNILEEGEYATGRPQG
ncbi:uncharacterized protein METZ01_LOCUS87708, partial [marine metagenome]